MRTGLTAEMVAQLGDYRNADYPPAWKAALGLADHIAAGEGPMPAELHDELRLHFGEDELVLLGALLGVGSGFQRFIEAFGIRPDHYVEGQAGPWEGDTA